MIITMKRSLLMALNPILIYGYIKVVGAPFIALGFVLLSLYESSQWFQHTALKFHSWIKYPLLSFAEFYFALVAFNLMGYVVYQYHAALGEHASVSYEEAYAKIAPREVTDQTLRELSSLLANGQQDAAIELLYEKLFLKWDDNDLHERYHKLLIATGKNLRAINHARAFINKLVIEKRFFKAMDLFEECLMIDSEFKLQDSFQVYELASAANVAKRYQLALDLLNDFDKKYPSHQHTPQVYFLNALIVSEKFQRNVEALQLFHTLKSKYPNHPLALESDNHIAAISKTNLIS
jgi:TolA-binding protein